MNDILLLSTLKYVIVQTNNGRDNIWRLIALIKCVATLLDCSERFVVTHIMICEWNIFRRDTASQTLVSKKMF